MPTTWRRRSWTAARGGGRGRHRVGPDVPGEGDTIKFERARTELQARIKNKKESKRNHPLREALAPREREEEEDGSSEEDEDF